MSTDKTIVDALNKKSVPVIAFLAVPPRMSDCAMCEADDEQDADPPRRYANKLVPDKGLALSAFDVLTAEDGQVTWGNGLMYYKG